jgi:hypothetical protein
MKDEEEDAGTRGHGDAGTRGHGDRETRRHDERLALRDIRVSPLLRVFVSILHPSSLLLHPTP